MQLDVDGRDVDLPETMAYKGMMLSDVPNLALAIGYTNASWTLKCDLTGEYVCRLLLHGRARLRPAARRSTTTRRSPRSRCIDFSSGYVQRSIDQFPRQGSRAPWRLGLNYALDVITLRHGKINDGTMRFSRLPRAQAPSEAAGVTTGRSA